jgi:hypothetical protein
MIQSISKAFGNTVILEHYLPTVNQYEDDSLNPSYETSRVGIQGDQKVVVGFFQR